MVQYVGDLRRLAHPQVAIILIGNKADCGQMRAVSFEDGKSFAEHERLIFIETSANDATSVTAAFEVLTTEVLRRIEEGDLPQPVPAKSSRPKA
jgi:hypothetical protein